MKKLLSFILCLALVISFTGCGKETSGKSIDAKVGTWKTAQTIQPFFYQDYLKTPDKVEISAFTNPGDMKTALLAGSLDMCGTTLVTAITAASKGEPVVVVCGLANKCSALVVGKDSNIKTEADLKGKKIAYVPGTMHHLLLLEVLRRNGLDPEKDVELKRIDFFDMGQALAQGTVDAFYSGEPYPSLAVAEGYGRILSYPNDDEKIGIINAAMITTKDKIQNNPEMIQKLVTAHAKATEYLNASKNVWLTKAAEFGTDKKVLDVAANNIELFWNMDEDYISHVKNLAQRMKEQGLISQIPDIDAMFDLSFVEQAEKELK
ncbi:ABC transporter substrate-binding protein [Dehalobacter sp. DCM]|uniref:ABC transporter substrate-binding protein n=1 Tax=Dehalobacter sp. DCM TaxID=2907827 RepID=UPI00308193B1|nr:ABC transporter substrate-binding protein [Dehalobacter sp. DCM]